MKIDCQDIADSICREVKRSAGGLNTKPTLAVIQIGNDPSSTSFIRQKQKTAALVGARVLHHVLPTGVQAEKLKDVIDVYNHDRSVHGIIIQRPVPDKILASGMLDLVSREKDVDGFVYKSPYTVPVALAVGMILHYVHNLTQGSGLFSEWLSSMRVTVLGRGETAGKPIAGYVMRLGVKPDIIHSKTPENEKIKKVRNSNIVISCVGRDRVLTEKYATPGSVFISVGIWRGADSTYHGDYREDEIKDKVAYFTSTPGGVGPVNVACLMKNLVEAAKTQTSRSL